MSDPAERRLTPGRRASAQEEVLMAELRGGSLLFSLARLRDLEQERVEAEAARERQRLESEVRAQAEREHYQREADRMRTLEIERRQAREVAAQREMEARAAAVKQAQLERARVEAEARSQIELLQCQQEHQRRLAQLSQVGRDRRDRVVLLVSATIAVVTVALAVGLYFGRVRPEQERMQAAYRELIRVAKERADYAERVAADTGAKNAALEGEIERLEQDLEAARKSCGPLEPRKPAADAPRPPAIRPPDRPVTKGPCINDGDPLNPCLG